MTKEKQLELRLRGESSVPANIVKAVKKYLATHTYQNSRNLPKEDWIAGPFKLSEITFNPEAGGYTIYPVKPRNVELWSFDEEYHRGLDKLGKKLGVDLHFNERELMGDEEGM